MRQLTAMSMLLAVASGLYLVERQLLGGTVYPGVKLGLANSVTMVVLLLYGNKQALTFSLARVLLSGLLSGSLGSVSFLLSLAGSLLSTEVMAAAIVLGKRHLSLAGIGALGGISHNMGQLLVYVLLTRQTLIFGYGPKLVLFGTASGFVLGFAVQLLVNRLWVISSGRAATLAPASFGQSGNQPS